MQHLELGRQKRTCAEHSVTPCQLLQTLKENMPKKPKKMPVTLANVVQWHSGCTHTPVIVTPFLYPFHIVIIIVVDSICTARARLSVKSPVV